MIRNIREKVVRFGPNQGLVGILTTSKAAPAGLPHVVIVNAGIIHRVGPNRLYVDMARAVAELGYPVLRFDLSGLGDSESVPGSTSLTESAIADTRAAMDHLAATRQATEFLVFGLCSGANYSAVTAFLDPRVIGLMLVDPSVARTRRSKLLHVARRLTHASTLRELVLLRHPVFNKKLANRWSAAMMVAHAAGGQSGQRQSFDAASPTPEAARQSLEALVARGVQLMFVFTGGVNHVYNYHGQLFDLLPGLDFRNQLRLHYMPDTDHTVSDTPGRSEFIRLLLDWLTHTFPAPIPAVSDTAVAHAGTSA